MKNKTLALLNCHNSPALGALTESRPLASTSFLGRYALMDFALSNFTNSGISNTGVLVKDHQRSIQKHMGNMMSWANNTKTGRTALFFNEQGILNPAYNTDLNNIKQNKECFLKKHQSKIFIHIILRMKRIFKKRFHFGKIIKECSNKFRSNFEVII